MTNMLEKINTFLKESRYELSDDANELVLHAENDGQLYRSQFIPIIKNYILKICNAKYDSKQAVKGWKNFMDNAAKSYNAEYGHVFSPQVRMEAAVYFEKQELEMIKSGEYDNFVFEGFIGIKKFKDSWEDIRKQIDLKKPNQNHIKV